MNLMYTLMSPPAHIPYGCHPYFLLAPLCTVNKLKGILEPAVREPLICRRRPVLGCWDLGARSRCSQALSFAAAPPLRTRSSSACLRTNAPAFVWKISVQSSETNSFWIQLTNQPRMDRSRHASEIKGNSDTDSLSLKRQHVLPSHGFREDRPG